MRRLAGVALTVAAASLLVSSCENEEESRKSAAPSTLPIEEAPPLPAAAVRYFEPADCPPATAVAPNVGDRFDYALADATGAIVPGAEMRETVTAVSASLVEYEEAPFSGGEALAPGERRSLYSAVVAGPGERRSYRFSPDDLKAVDQLTPGQSVSLAGEETSHLGSSRTVPGTWKVTFQGCGTTTSQVKGAPNQPVKVYRLVNFYRSARPEGDVLRTTEIERLVSVRTGWKVLDREAAGVTILVNASR